MNRKIPSEIYKKLQKVDSRISSLLDPKNKGKMASANLVNALIEDLAFITGQLNELYAQLSAIVASSKKKKD